MDLYGRIADGQGSMSERIAEIYRQAAATLEAHCALNERSMCRVQAMGYNGFKRWHRHRAQELFSLKMRVENELFDKFRIEADFKKGGAEHSPQSLQEHLKAWDSALLDGMKALGEASRAHFSETGERFFAAEEALKILGKDSETVWRLARRFTDSDWLTIDIHAADCELHEKFKKKETKNGR